jgi:hypothetical protein
MARSLRGKPRIRQISIFAAISCEVFERRIPYGHGSQLKRTVISYTLIGAPTKTPRLHTTRRADANSVHASFGRLSLLLRMDRLRLTDITLGCG